MSFRQTIKRFFGPVRYSTKGFVITMLLRIYQAGLTVASANMLKTITQYIVNGDQTSIINFSLRYAVAIIVYFVVLWFFQDEETISYIESNYYIFRDNLKKVITMENNYYEKIGTGKLLEQSRGSIQRASLLSDILGPGVHTMAILLFSIITISFINPGYLVILLIGIALIAIIYYLLYPYTDALQQARKKIRGENTRFAVKLFMSKNEVLHNNKQEQEFQTLFGHLQREKENIHSRNLYQYRIFKFPEFLVYAIQVSIVIIFGIGAIKGTNSIGDFAMFVGLLTLIQKSIFDLLKILRNVDFNWVHIQKLREVMDNAPLQNVSQGNDFIYNSGNITLDNISFSYDNNKPIFSDFSLMINGGTKIALVGDSGGGKSTLIKLIAGYMRPDAGEVLIDGQPLSKTKLSDYYRHIGYLTQEPSVFDGTILENLLYGLAEDSETTEVPETSVHSENSELSEIISLSRCEFIYDLPQGIHTEIGERGVRLSGGQKQRLAIAKIMLKNPSIILLDEPTSALDSFNEELVSQALTNLFQGKTVIVVAHRLQTVKNSDRILYIGTPTLERGARGDHSTASVVLEEGTHESLIALGGRYKKMLDLQSGF